MTDLTPEENARLDQLTKDYENRVVTPPDDIPPELFSPTMGVLMRLQRYGLVPPGNIHAMIPDLENYWCSYAVGVAQLQAQEDEQGWEFPISLHVTNVGTLLANADLLEEKFGHRPVTLTEAEAIAATTQEENATDTTA